MREKTEVVIISRLSRDIGLPLYPTDWLEVLVMNWHFPDYPMIF